MKRRFFLILFLSCISVIAYNQSRDLDFYLKEALQNSPLLNDFRNQINSAVADSFLIKAARKPYIEAISSLQASPYSRNFGYDDVITNGGNYTAVLGVNQKILNKKEITNKYSSVDLQKQSATNSSRISVTELNKVITDQYLVALSSYDDYLFNKTFLGLFETENEIVKQFVKNGVCKQTDYLSLSVETQSQEILVIQLKSQYRKDLSLLNQVCGLNDSSWIELTAPRIIVKGAPDIAKSPLFIQYKIDSLRIENEKAAIDIRYKPKINWFADAGFLTSNPWNLYKHFGYSAGIGLNVPVYDGKQRDMEKRKLEFNENSRKMYEDTYRKKYFQQIQQLNEELMSLIETSVQMEKQLKTSDQLVIALKEQLEAGIIQMTEYINAIRNFKSISRNINLINVQKLQVINEINFLLTQ